MRNLRDADTDLKFWNRSAGIDRMAKWLPFIAFDDIVESTINRIEAFSVKLILLLIEGSIFGYKESCTHQGHPLSLGELEENVLTCAKHLWEFEVRTGNRKPCGQFSFLTYTALACVSVPLHPSQSSLRLRRSSRSMRTSKPSSR